MGVAVCNHFAGFIASMLVFTKARSLRSLTPFGPLSTNKTPRYANKSTSFKFLRSSPMQNSLAPILILLLRRRAKRSEARRGAFLMKHERTKRAKRIEWGSVSSVVDVAVCSHFAGFIASILGFLKARSLRSLTSRPASNSSSSFRTAPSCSSPYFLRSPLV